MDNKEFMESLVFSDEEVPEDQVPPRGMAVMVVRSLRLPVELDERIKTAATQRGASASTLIREWIELGLTALEQDEPISRADALRALAGVRRIEEPGADQRSS